MIKSGTLCMIRNVPSHAAGHEFNGNIVVVKGFKKPDQRIYWIEPELFDQKGYVYTGCREQWLYPFEDFDPQELNVTTKELETL
jgi:hypothetical protein